MSLVDFIDTMSDKGKCAQDEKNADGRSMTLQLCSSMKSDSAAFGKDDLVALLQQHVKTSVYTDTEIATALASQISKFGGVIVNYDMSVLGQTGGRGHFSVVVSMVGWPPTDSGDKASLDDSDKGGGNDLTESHTGGNDAKFSGPAMMNATQGESSLVGGSRARISREVAVLLLDPWPETPCGWVRLLDLIHAMRTFDKGGGAWRGWIELGPGGSASEDALQC